MKKILTLFMLFVTSISHGLDGYSQVRMEKIYDSYRARFIDGKTIEEQTEKIQKIQKILATYKNNKKISTVTKAMYAYLQHLFCEAESIIDGIVCQDKYITPGVLTDDIDTRKLSETRKILIKEHSTRRVQRGLGELKESNTLNTIAQNYANALCAAGYITHELNGSKLEERYDAGGYLYEFGGENLGSGQLTVAQILDQLTTSIYHRKNMYEPDFTEIGVGQCRDIWVLNYGTPSKA